MGRHRHKRRPNHDIWALSSGRRVGVRRLHRSRVETRIRKMVVYAQGRPGRRGADASAGYRTRCRRALERGVAATHGRAEGVPVLREMLDRRFVEQTVRRDVRQYEDMDPVADVMISGLRAAAVLKDATLRASVEGLSQQDRSLRVRQAALEALKTMG